MRLCDLTQYGHVFVLIGNVYSLLMVLGNGSVSL